MVKEEIITEAGERGYLDMDGLGDEDFFEWLLPSSYFSSSGVSTATTGATPAAASSPIGVSTATTGATPAAASSPIGVSTAITGATPAAASSPIGVSTAITGATPAAASSPIGVSIATTGATPAAASSPIGVSYMNMALPYHHMPSFTGQEQYDYHHGNGPFGLQYNGGGRTIPVVAPQKSSPTTECSSSISMSSPTATSTSSTKPQAFKKKGSRCSDQRKDAPAADKNKKPSAPAADKNKKPRVRRESLGERIAVLQQLVSPFGKSDTATVLQDSASYIRSLHEQIQVLSSPYMQRLPASEHATMQESAAGTVVEPPQRASDLRSRGLCLVPISCTDHIAGDGHSNGANPWSVAVPAGTTTVTAAAGSKGAAAMLPGGQPRHLA